MTTMRFATFYLDGCETDPRRIVHGLEHAIDNVPQLSVHFGDRFSLASKPSIGKLQNFK